MSKIDTTTLVAAVGNPGVSGSFQEELARVLSQKLSKELAEESAAKAELEASRQAQIASVREQQATKALEQARCPHYKQNYQSALGGQRDHKGHIHLVCQFCTKEFIDDVPVNLRVQAETIGGPQY